jgi:hypothetical protein
LFLHKFTGMLPRKRFSGYRGMDLSFAIVQILDCHHLRADGN